MIVGEKHVAAEHGCCGEMDSIRRLIPVLRSDGGRTIYDRTREGDNFRHRAREIVIKVLEQSRITIPQRLDMALHPREVAGY